MNIIPSRVKRAQRRYALAPVTVRLPDGNLIKGMLRDFSDTGASFILGGPALELPPEFELQGAGKHGWHPVQLVWQKQKTVGIKFMLTGTDHASAAVEGQPAS